VPSKDVDAAVQFYMEQVRRVALPQIQALLEAAKEKE